MSNRALCGVLTLLFLIAPISAAYCGECTIAGCDSETMAHDATAESSAKDAIASGHCPQEPPASEDPLTCRSALSWGAVENCCSLSAATDPGEIALLTLASPVEFAVRLVSSIDEPTLQFGEGDGRWHHPSAIPLPPSLQPLFALHSSFLI